MSVAIYRVKKGSEVTLDLLITGIGDAGRLPHDTNANFTGISPV
jgi:hypothetical protein